VTVGTHLRILALGSRWILGGTPPRELLGHSGPANSQRAFFFFGSGSDNSFAQQVLSARAVWAATPCHVCSPPADVALPRCRSQSFCKTRIQDGSLFAFSGGAWELRGQFPFLAANWRSSGRFSESSWMGGGGGWGGGGGGCLLDDGHASRNLHPTANFFSPKRPSAQTALSPLSTAARTYSIDHFCLLHPFGPSSWIRFALSGTASVEDISNVRPVRPQVSSAQRHRAWNAPRPQEADIFSKTLAW